MNLPEAKVDVVCRLWEEIESGGKYYKRIRGGNRLHTIHFGLFKKEKRKKKNSMPDLTAHEKAGEF